MKVLGDQQRRGVFDQSRLERELAEASSPVSYTDDIDHIALGKVEAQGPKGILESYDNLLVSKKWAKRSEKPQDGWFVPSLPLYLEIISSAHLQDIEDFLYDNPHISVDTQIKKPDTIVHYDRSFKQIIIPAHCPYEGPTHSADLMRSDFGKSLLGQYDHLPMEGYIEMGNANDQRLKFSVRLHSYYNGFKQCVTLSVNDFSPELVRLVKEAGK